MNSIVKVAHTARQLEKYEARQAQRRNVQAAVDQEIRRQVPGPVADIHHGTGVTISQRVLERLYLEQKQFHQQRLREAA